MTGKEPIEERLENLGRAIGSGESIVDDVMSRIEVSSVAEHERMKQSKAEVIASRFILSRFTKLAAAALIIIAVVLSIAVFERSVRPAYGISDVPGLLRSAKTLHVKAWSYFPEDISPGKVQRRVALESWYDLENGRFRTMSAGYNNVPENTTLSLVESVYDGHYVMGVKHCGKSVTFYKLSPFQHKLHVHQNILDFITQMFGAPERLDEFNKIGEGIIDGEQYDIWQGKVNNNFKVESWLSPDTGELVRALVSKKHGGGDWSDSYEVEKVERNIDIPAEIFATVATEGYTLDNTKDSAQIPELQTGCTCYQDDLLVATHIAFTMPNGSVILAWRSQDTGSGVSQAPIFKNLKGGGPLPKLPIELYALTSVGGGASVTYDGRHLSHTTKAGKFYEWSIYVPTQTPFPRCDFLGYYTLPRFNPPKDRVLFSLGLLNDMLIENEQDFNKWVLGAMAELSDDGKVPADITYEGVLELTEQIRESFVE